LKVDATLRLFLGEGADEVYDVPDFVGLQAAFFARHFAFAIVNDVVDVAVGQDFQRGGVAEIVKLQVHVFGEVAVASALFAVAHGAILAKFLFAGGEGGRRWLNGIIFFGGVRGGLGVGSGFIIRGLGGFLRAALQRQKQSGTHKDTGEREFHIRVSLSDSTRQSSIGRSLGKYNPLKSHCAYLFFEKIPAWHEVFGDDGMIAARFAIDRG
jgi:hypothetical protein